MQIKNFNIREETFTQNIIISKKDYRKLTFKIDTVTMGIEICSLKRITKVNRNKYLLVYLANNILSKAA